jgi:hypothetical protein
VFDLRNDAVELVDELGSTRGLDEHIDQCSVVPERAFLFAREPGPELVADAAVVAQDRARVVQLVRGRDEPDWCGRIFQLGDVRLLAWPPVRLRDLERVRAAFDNGGDRIAEPQPYVLDPAAPAGVLAGVVEERADRLGFIGAVLEGDAGDPEQVREVRNFVALRSWPAWMIAAYWRASSNRGDRINPCYLLQEQAGATEVGPPSSWCHTTAKPPFSALLPADFGEHPQHNPKEEDGKLGVEIPGMHFTGMMQRRRRARSSSSRPVVGRGAPRRGQSSRLPDRTPRPPALARRSARSGHATGDGVARGCPFERKVSTQKSLSSLGPFR